MRLHPYAGRVLAQLGRSSPWEREFLQAVEEVFTSIGPLLEQEGALYERSCLLERLTEPERIIIFRVPWTDDRGQAHVNRGFRVQFSSVLGPYKGGLRFHASVKLDSLKFLGFEQTFKNALTGLSLGGGKGGSDFQSRGRSEGEIMRFCQSYMTELYRHIGPSIDVPAGDIGVGAREIGYLFGQYRRLSGRFDGALTGKGTEWGGSLLRPEATGYGLAYFTEEALSTRGQTLEGKTVAVSGFGNVAWGAVRKVNALGGRVVTLSGPDGFVHDEAGVRGERVDYMRRMRIGGRDEVLQYAEEFGVPFERGKKPWIVPCDVALPCAIQNELDRQDAEQLVRNGCIAVVEGANMPTTPDAAALFSERGVLFAPGKASNAGGVAVSGLEMTQNRTGRRWTDERIDRELQQIMRRIHAICASSAERAGRPGDYVAGANMGGFERVAAAMMDQGLV